MRIVFMGTPDFAVPSLKILVENGYNIIAVITAPDKPVGRGLKVIPSAVKKYAESVRIPVLQPTNLKDEHFYQELVTLQPDLQIVVAFRMLPEKIWNLPPKGTFNLHASLLPQYRGAAPINWAVINGDKETGVTTFFLDKEIDTGKIIDQTRVPIYENDTAGDIHDQLMIIGAQLVLKTVNNIAENKIKAIEQSMFISTNTALKHAPKIFKEDCKIDWNMDCFTIKNRIRGFAPYPSAWTNLITTNGETNSFKLFSCDIEINPLESIEIGSIITDHKTFLKVKCKDGFVLLQDIQPAGKNRMCIDAYLRGANTNHFEKFI